MFLYDMKSEQVILIEQCRACTIATEGQNHWLIEPVAGMMDPGETSAHIFALMGRVDMTNFKLVCSEFNSFLPTYN